MADRDETQDKHLLIDWTNVMSVKNARMDADHKRLVDLINELYEAMWFDKAETVIQKSLDSLKQYVHYHFRAEEELLEKASYPGLAAHKAVHRELIGALAAMEKRWQDGDLEVSEQLMDLLQGWLVDHIMKIDMQYSAYLKD